MSDHSACPLCQSLLEELRSALDELRSSPQNQNTSREAVEAIRDLSGGSEEDAGRAEQILRAFRPGIGGPAAEYQPNRVAAAIRKMQEHRVRTGHSVLPGF